MPSKPAGNSNQTTTSTQSVQLPGWVEDFSKNILNQATNVSSGLQPAVAGMTGGQNALIQALAANVGSGNNQYSQALQGAGAAQAYQPQMVTPGFLSGTNLAPYLNPYTQSVIDPSIALMEQGRATSNQGIADAAAKTGAFAGSRQGVAEGVNNAQTNLQEGQLGAQLNAANFNNAQQQAQTDLARSLVGQQSNQAAGLQGANLNLQGSNSLANIAQMYGNQNLQQILAALQGQNQGQAQTQQQLTATQQNPINQLQILLSAIGGVPYGHTQTGTQTGMGPVSNPTLQGLGGLSSLAGTAGNIGGLFADGGVFGAGAGAAGAGAAGLGATAGIGDFAGLLGAGLLV